MGLRPTSNDVRPEQTALFRLVQEHIETLNAYAQEAAGTDLPQFARDEFSAFVEFGILAHGFCRLHCADCDLKLEQARSVVDKIAKCFGSASNLAEHWTPSARQPYALSLCPARRAYLELSR